MATERKRSRSYEEEAHRAFRVAENEGDTLPCMNTSNNLLYAFLVYVSHIYAFICVGVEGDNFEMSGMT